MVVAAHRAYADAKKWLRSARPRRILHTRFAWRAFGASFVAGIILLGVISLVAPDSFGNPGSNTLGQGWPLLVLIGLLAMAVLVVVLRVAHLRWLFSRFREPFRRPLRDHPSFDGIADALAECPGAYRTRFAASFVWLPAGLAILGVTFAFSVAYYVIDAVLARFLVGWEQAVYAAACMVLSLIFFGVAAGRLSTWRLAVSVHKEVSTGYPG